MSRSSPSRALEADAKLLGDDPCPYAALVLVELENLADDELHTKSYSAAKRARARARRH